MDKIFNQYTTSEGIPFYLLSKSVHFPDNNEDLYSYVYIDSNIPWTILSHQIYGTISNWWILSSLNKDAPFYAKAGTIIKIIKPTVIEDVLRYI